MKNIQLVIFDCDGVMFDTSNANTQYYNHILNHFGKPQMTREQFAYSHMHTVDQALAHLFGDAAELAAAKDYRKQMSYLPFLAYMQIEPDLKPLLKRIRPPCKTAIATNRTDTMNRVLENHGLKPLFDLVVTALDVRHPKPQPDQLVKILDHFACQPTQAIYVGDSELDQKAARAAGIPFVAYANRALSADHHISRLGEVAELL